MLLIFPFSQKNWTESRDEPAYMWSIHFQPKCCQFNGESKVFLRLTQLCSLGGIYEPQPQSYSIHKITWNRSESNIKAKTVRLPGEKEKKSSLGVSKDFLGRTQKILTMKEERSQLTSSMLLLFKDHEKASHRLGENILNAYMWQRSSIPVEKNPYDSAVRKTTQLF